MYYVHHADIKLKVLSVFNLRIPCLTPSKGLSKRKIVFAVAVIKLYKVCYLDKHIINVHEQ